MKHMLLLAVVKGTRWYTVMLVFFSVLSVALSAQNLVYAKSLGNTTPLGGDVTSRSIRTDNLGYTYVTGYFSGSADFAPGTPAANLKSVGGTDIFVAKYDPAGNYVYAKAMGGSGDDNSYSVAIDGFGNAYVTGGFVGTADFDPGPGVANLTSAGNIDIFFAKYDPAGNYVYAKAMRGNGFEAGFGIAVDGSGNAFITGRFFGVVDFDPGAGTANRISVGANDIFIARYDASGNFVYAKNIGSSLVNSGNSIAVDGSGNVYVTGFFTRTVDFDPGAGIASLSSVGGSFDVFIASYDASGNFVYAKGMGGTGEDIGYGIAVDGAGFTHVTGNFASTADLDPDMGIANLTSAGSSDVFIARYDAAGSYVYAKGIGGINEDIGYGIAVDGSGNSFVTGSFIDTGDFDPGTGIANLTSAGFRDIFVARYDASGNYVYAKAMGGLGDDIGYGIAVGGLRDIYTTGVFAEIADFDPGTGTVNLTIEGSTINAFISSLSNTGDFVWAGQLGIYTNTALNDQGSSIAVDALGNTYITGHFSGTLDFDAGAADAYLTSAGDQDIFFAKYDASGNYIYAKAIGGIYIDRGTGIAIDQLGNVYLTGSFDGTADFDPGAGYFALASAGYPNAFFAKYDASGNLVYAKALSGLFEVISTGIAVDGAGNAFITGHFHGTVDFDPGAGFEYLTSTGVSSDIFVARYDEFGNYVYARAFGAGNDDVGLAIDVDGSGNVYVTGSFIGIVDFDPGTAIENLTSKGTNDIFIAKYDAAGNYVYAKNMGGASSDAGYDIAVDGDGNAHVTGFFIGTADFDPGGGTADLTSAGFTDVFIARYDASGNYVYAKSMGGFNADRANSVVIDGSGNLFITGYFSGTADFDPGVGTANLTSAGEIDIFVASYDGMGNYVYAKRMGGATGSGGGFGIAVDGLSNAYATGSFSGTVDFDPGGSAANATLSAANAADIFLAKLNPSTILPVELLSFTAKVLTNPEAVKLNWGTASQFNNAYFAVERSKNGQSYEAIGRRPGCSACTGMQQYEFTDYKPYSGASYYRLKQVDYDGRFSYSSVVQVTLSSNVKANVQVYPNITDGAFELRISNNSARKQVRMSLLNALGGVIRQETIWLSEGDNRLRYSLGGQAKGVYYLKVGDIKGKTENTVMVIKK